jgi:carbonic anhydrase
MVLKKPASASQAQIKQFARAVGMANNRPVQPLGARPVLQ